MCDLIASKIKSMIQIYHGFNHKNKIRATTAHAVVVVPLDVLQNISSADH
jgi:hypothetical protein